MRFGYLLSIYTIIILVIFISPPLQAAQESIPLGRERRIRTFIYNPNTIFVYTGHYRYTSTIEFSPSESIATISIGDGSAWDIKSAGSRMFIKPIDQDATTNMTVFTNKRIYLFEIHAEEADDIRDEDLALSTRFTYPETTGISNSIKQFVPEEEEVPNYLISPERYNFNYTISGSSIISPLKIFDDGEFTYMEFRDKNAVIPAVFMVDENGRESLVNYRMSGNYIVIERVVSQFTLRNGEHVACIFNEMSPFQKKKQEEKKKKFLGIF